MWNLWASLTYNISKSYHWSIRIWQKSQESFTNLNNRKPLPDKRVLLVEGVAYTMCLWRQDTQTWKQYFPNTLRIFSIFCRSYPRREVRKEGKLALFVIQRTLCWSSSSTPHTSPLLSLLILQISKLRPQRSCYLLKFTQLLSVWVWVSIQLHLISLNLHVFNSSAWLHLGTSPRTLVMTARNKDEAQALRRAEMISAMSRARAGHLIKSFL